MSKKATNTVSFVVLVLCFICGLILIFASPHMAQAAGDNAIRRNGGSLNTNQYELMIQNTADSVRAGGCVISLVAGFGVILYFNRVNRTQ